MAKLGSSKRPVVVRVQTQARAEEILALCDDKGWQVIASVEPDQDEDISDFERLLHPQRSVKAAPMPGRNSPCPCGSGKKYKKCCAANTGPGSPEVMPSDGGNRQDLTLGELGSR